MSGATALKDLGRRFGERLYEREARFLASQEFAVTADDVLERRTKHALRLTPYERRTFVEWFDGARLKGGGLRPAGVGPPGAILGREFRNLNVLPSAHSRSLIFR